MKMAQKILNTFNGLHYPQEYLCLDKYNFQPAIRANLYFGDKFVNDVTALHLFTGYSPLIFSFFSRELDWPDEIRIVFESNNERKTVARIRMKRIRIQKIEDGTILHYEGIHGSHRFSSAWHQYIIE